MAVAVVRPRDLFVVRHAAPLVQGLCYGRTDVAVAVEPRAAAAVVAQQLPQGIDNLYASPTGRTRTLAAALATELGVPLRVDPRLCELDFGAWEGRSWDCIHALEPEALRAWAEAPLLRAPSQGETGRSLLGRLLAFTAELGPMRALLVCHAGPIRALRALAALPPDERSPEAVATFDFARPVEPLAVERIRWCEAPRCEAAPR